MNMLLATAGVVALVTGIVHSVLGELLIFRHLRAEGLVPTLAPPPLRERHIRSIWASWHVVSVFGWAFAGLLLRLAIAPDESPRALIISAVLFANLAGALLVLVGTRGKHPGWIALSLVAVLTWFGASAT